MKQKNEPQPGLDEVQKLAANLIIGKNKWLTKIRWFYSFFVAIFIVVYQLISGADVIDYRSCLLAVGLSFLGNILFIVTIQRNLQLSKNDADCAALYSLPSLQLDFDLVVLSLLVYYSGGFQSPLVVLFIFYVMLSTFLIHHEKAIRSTFTAMILVVVIYFTDQGLIISAHHIATMLGFNVILFFSYLISAYLSRNLRENEERVNGLLNKFKEQSVTDGLTGLYNQSHFFLLLNLQLEKAKRYKSLFSLIIFDVDNFKNYNDNNGHINGSQALRRVGEIMRKTFRASDMLAKYGGDEFVIILPHSDKLGAFLGAERLRETIENEPFPGRELQPKGKVTLSLGIASYPAHGDTTTEILDRADKALYAAKESGRNKTVMYSDELENAPNASEDRRAG